MKHLSIFCVNYNSYDVLDAYLHSIDQSAGQTVGSALVDVFIADNTENDIKPIDTVVYNNTNMIKVFAFHENIGYFKAITRMMKTVDTTLYDFVIISNVDMTLRTDTLSSLLTSQHPNATGWIAPAIISRVTGNDLNPQATRKYSSIKLKTMRWFYRLPPIYNLYVSTFHRLKRMRTNDPGEVYAGHGSFIILTREYIARCGIIDYPVFLYCEEIYIAEECAQHGLKVIYNPDIHVDDIGKVSTGKAPKSNYYRWNIEGITYILNKYY